MREDNKRLLDSFNEKGVDVLFLLQEAFLGYKNRKHCDKLYSEDGIVPTKLIKAYYSLNPGVAEFDNFKKAFVSHYISNESKIEEVDLSSIHGQEEIEGLKEMYNYIHSDDIDYMFDVYTLKELHRKLYSKAPFPEYGGDFRNRDVYLPGTGTEISEWSMIRTRLNELDPEIIRLKEQAPSVRVSGDPNQLLKFLDACVIVNCKLVKIHPFNDGNGRTIRGFINKILEDAGLPPIYIKVNERTAYHKAMNNANNEEDYSEILAFYRYKICDSLIELDINDRIKNNSLKEHGRPKVLKRVKK